MNIYTKTGDAGTTSLSYGGRVGKDDIRIDTYGTLDELNAQLGVVRAMDADDEDSDTLLQLQRLIIDGTAVLARPVDERKQAVEQRLSTYVESLERRIDQITAQLPAQHTFLLPGGTLRAAQTHVARVVCRRAERRLVAATSPHFGSAAFLQFLNRMSDYLYMLARRINASAGVAENTMP